MKEKSSTLPARKRARLNSPAQPARRPRSRAPGLKLRRVLVAIDFSPASREALAFALPLIKEFQAELHLAHVFAADYPLSSMAALPLIVPEIEVESRVRSHLERVAETEAAVIRRENVHALKGRPFEEIGRLARALRIDLIVTATRGRTGLKHLALGSTAERLVRHAPCPVLVVHPRGGAVKRRRPSFQKILVPTDFSACADKGLAYARALARKFGARLTLLNSVDLHYYSTNPEFILYDLPPLLAASEESARDQMQELVKGTNWDGIAVETILESGHAGEQICRQAEKGGAELIVTSTHGKTGLAHIFIGSTAEYVVRHAPCPVLVVPSHPRP